MSTKSGKRVFHSFYYNPYQPVAAGSNGIFKEPQGVARKLLRLIRKESLQVIGELEIRHCRNKREIMYRRTTAIQRKPSPLHQQSEKRKPEPGSVGGC